MAARKTPSSGRIVVQGYNVDLGPPGKAVRLVFRGVKLTCPANYRHKAEIAMGQAVGMTVRGVTLEDVFPLDPNEPGRKGYRYKDMSIVDVLDKLGATLIVGVKKAPSTKKKFYRES